MGFWTGIKYALNSSIGKHTFVPLDELIKGYRHIELSPDNILFTPNILRNEFYYSDNNTRIKIADIKFKIYGSINIATQASRTVVTIPPYAGMKLEIEKNGQLVYSYDNDATTFNSNIIIHPKIDVDINDEISVYIKPVLYSSANVLILNSLEIRGNISSTPIFNV